MILLINTSDASEVIIGLTKAGKMVAKKQFKAPYRQAEILLAKIDDLLVLAKCELRQLKGIAVVSGPGPFTALRIGIATANTLAWALKIPIVGIKLKEFKDLNELVEVITKKMKKAKLDSIVPPFYGKEPNITMKKIAMLVGIFILFLPALAFAADNANIDSDSDGLTDFKEINIYHTDPNNADTDGDGFADNQELINGYSPLYKDKRLVDTDSDGDGLNDGYELALHTDLKNSDSNSNSVSDGEEFKQGLDPSKPDKVKLEKWLDVNLTAQRLNYYLGPVRLNVFTVSTGKALTPTPVGTFKITAKRPKAWSRLAGLWMPYWMQFDGANALHELPEWPNGTKEGTNHLGTPVSHGCIRLGIGPAKFIYDWAPVGTKLVIHK
ncbi:MAG: tRNA (adenosine(37)-N6)-threonylcarbamoyltransferase complex dimerization subunit type 1 TsaB [Patescibacteria group bacterium]